jgi:hypothetical protein
MGRRLWLERPSGSGCENNPEFLILVLLPISWEKASKGYGKDSKEYGVWRKERDLVAEFVGFIYHASQHSLDIPDSLIHQSSGY